MRVALAILLLCGATAGWSLARVTPKGLVQLCEQEVVAQPFHLSQSKEVTEDRWFFLPQLWGDFDLQMDLELSEGAEVDVLLRQVQPRFLDEVQLPFAGRFATLRISAEGDGGGWRSREQALFGPRGDGVGLEPGRPATIWIEARGTQLTANVGGKRQAVFEAADVYGMFTLLVRGGKAVIHRLDIAARPVGDLWQWKTSTWVGFGALAALLVAGIAALLTRRPQLGVAGGALLGLSVTAVSGLQLPLMFPSPAGLAVVLAGATAVAIFVSVLEGRRRRIAAGAVAAVVVCMWSWPALGAATLARAVGGDDAAEVEAVFGPGAGAQLSESLGQIVRMMPAGLLTSGKAGRRAFLLGGEWLYNRGEPGEHVGVTLGRMLGGAFGEGCDAPSLPTVDGYSAQQWRLFDGFYQGFEPDVVVFGIGESEAARDAPGGAPRSTPASLAATLRAVRDDCRARRRGLVLFVDVGTPEPLRKEARRLAEDGVPLVELTDEIPRLEVARRLFAAVRPLVR